VTVFLGIYRKYPDKKDNYSIGAKILMNDRDSCSDSQDKCPENCASCSSNQEKTLIIVANILMNHRDSCSDSQGKYPEKCASCSTPSVEQ
jgi:hypothetical protein